MKRKRNTPKEVTIFHLSAPKMNATPYRREKYEGSTHLVFPVVLLKEGVHNGSAGPTFYPAAELKKYPSAWNGIPLPVYHPTDEEGTPVIANDPATIEKQSVGRLFNVYYDEDDVALKGEIWVHEDKVQKVSPAVLDILMGAGFLEVSTGLYADGDGTPGIWNDESYNETASNFRPEHLALLPGIKGACSWEDGCGVRVNNEKGATNYNIKIHAGDLDDATLEKLKETMVEVLTANEIDIDQSLTFDDLTINALSHNDISNLIYQALKQENGGNDSYIWLSEVYKTFIIYEKEDTIDGNSARLLKRGYSMNGNNITLSDDIIEVQKETKYVPLTNQEDEMNKEEFVQGLIDNESNDWSIDDKETLLALSECQLKKLEAKEQEPVVIPEGAKAEIDGVPSVFTNGAWEAEQIPEDTDTEDPKTPTTMAEFLDGAPAEMREMLQNGLKMVQAEKDALVKAILANEANVFSEAILKGKDIDDLKAIAALANVKKEESTPDFSGNGGGPIGNQDTVEPMVAPEIDWSQRQ